MTLASVVDASALAAILFQEPRGGAVEEKLAGRRIFAPTLLPYELASVCLTKTRRYPSQREALLEALNVYEELDVHEVEVPPREAAEIAERTGLSAYDASYLWLARHLGVELVTLDDRLEKAARE